MHSFLWIPADSSVIPVDSGGFRSHSGGFQRIPVIPAGMCGAVRSTGYFLRHG
jgi:hypothetical protein